MASYELVFIVDPQLEDAAIEGCIEKVENFLIANGTEITKLERWGNRRLAYEIGERDQGFYVFVQFKGEKSLIGELGRELGLDEAILRHLVVKIKS